MKTRFILGGSLLLNAVLLVVIGVLRFDGSKAEPATTSIVVTNHVTNVVSVLQPDGGGSAVDTNASPAQQFDWRMVESADYREYIANLRAIGCPEETIRDIIIADVNKLFESRREDLQQEREPFKFWETGMQAMTGMMNTESLKENQALDKERRAVLKQLLGEDFSEPPDLMSMMNPLDRMLGYLPDQKKNRVMEIYQEYQVKAVESLGGGTPDQEDMKNMQAVQKEMEEAIAALLTPEEHEEYLLRLSQTAMVMRMQLDGFNPTEDEFREVFKLRKEFDDEYGLTQFSIGDTAASEQRQAAQKELDAAIQQVLGEERYADFQREKDWSFKQVAKTVERQGLPRESAVQVYDIKQLADQEAANLRNESGLSAERRAQALRRVREDTEASMQAILGQEAYDAVQGTLASQWLNAIAPPQPQAVEATKVQEEIAVPGGQ